MIELGPHAGFILWAYAGVAILLAGLVAYVVRDGRRVRTRLTELEERGVRRRSGGPLA